ncbi:MAG: ParB N-terminal domain-containing protein [Anaerolineae bacterium]|nr:ParB N-terminal domain-containing protein [Anaerolineae bacterium]
MSTRVLVEPNDLVFVQSRASTNTDLVDEYAEMMQSGVEFDPAQGVQDGNGQIYVFDGHHRGSAAKQIGAKLWVEVRPGTRLDAEWLALTANQKHGLRRNREDLRRIVRLALLHPRGVTLSDRELARHCGVHHNTVSKIRQELEVSGEISQIEKRLVTRNGQTYQVDTGNIGKSRAATTVEPSFAVTLAPQMVQHLRTEALPSDCKLEHVVKVGYPYDSTYYEPKAQEFECPHCGQEKIVGVNGSRRWCLNCSAEWPTAAAFLAAVQSEPSTEPTTGREAIRNRLRQLISLVDTCPDEQLAELATWLTNLEMSLTFASK